MNVVEFVHELRTAGVQLKVEAGALCAKPPQRLTPEIRATLAERRTEIIAAIEPAANTPSTYCKLVESPHVEEPFWVLGDERGLVAPEVLASKYPAVLAQEILYLGHPADIRELLAAKTVFGPRARAIEPEK